MNYYVRTRWGDSKDTPDEDCMREILAELDVDDIEHLSVSLHHESGWALSIYEDDSVVWEYIEEPPKEPIKPRHLLDVSRDEALRLWHLLSRGEFEAIESLPWQDGYGPPVSDEERDLLVREAAEAILALDLSFYDTLGPENPAKVCRHEGCARGTVQFSVFCRPHHFESLYKRTCPFQH